MGKASGKPYKVRRVDLAESLSFSGKVDAAEKSTMVFQIAGKLSFVKVKEGDLVKKGQLLAGLDTGDLAAVERAANLSPIDAIRYEQYSESGQSFRKYLALQRRF